MTVALGLVGADAAAAHADAVWEVYDAVFGDVADRATWQGTFDRHAARDGFRLALAHDDEALVGFAYGYTGSRGEYWSDRVVEALDRAVTDRWVGGHFELVELAVLDTCRRRGLGGRLHDLLLADLPHGRALLSTSADDDDPAVRLYTARGWRSLGLLAPDVQVMGRATPSP